MAHKYQLDGLLEEATRRLKSVFTDSFAKWEKNQGESTSLVEVDHTDAVEAFNLFRRIDQPEMLPTALYLCCRIRLDYLLQGNTRADRKTLERLDLDDLELCLKAQEELTTRKVKIALNLFRGDAPATSKPDHHPGCYMEELHRHDMMDFYTKADSDVLSLYFANYTKKLLRSSDWPICRTCVRTAADYERAERIAAWKRLPAYAGIEVCGGKSMAQV